MADLTPRVVDAKDEGIYDRATGKFAMVTRVWFMVGELGPFREEFAQGTLSDSELRARMDTKAAALRNFT